jgi:hypothetical protein
MDEEMKRLWEERFENQVASGKTVIDWCRETGVTKCSYYYWKKRLREIEAGKKAIEVPIFAQLPIAATEPVTVKESSISIRWEGFELMIFRSAQIPLAAELIKQLSQP